MHYDQSLPLAFKHYGEGPPLIIIHGLFGMGDNWQSVAQALASDFRAITLDLRNHGGSPHAHAMSFPLMAADVIRFIERQGFPWAHFDENERFVWTVRGFLRE
jgi:esterase